MKTLSVQQPWASFIVHGLKPIENRSWSTSIRDDILIHASKKYDDCLPMALRDLFPVGGIIGVARLVAITKESRSFWFEGPFGWIFEDARPLPFVACPGRLQLFDVDYDALYYGMILDRACPGQLLPSNE